ncbi:conserved hypothetical protein [Histoplasma capsulatum G186AR]|uniref:N-acetyltransferase domain-containing protein n=2 Tax=Ajellomyces capsulatus TaxID=5037 RepID=C0NPZ6_AJECG|nr:uncharacterized protein HCBG_05226 [Histoplasma capsulatum G186AR]EEH07006.1 conserved hypothetical protein [Histoplasma capsulatum G186AR]KAG5293966.1 GNAT family N-acetyltransferase [Histoplasma capsulatum]QSS75418.1 GNAT family N-acetyltransferase [Histoplasma capsulatum G186AR]
MAEAQEKYQHQFQSQSPPFPTQEWVQFFPSPSPKSPAGTATTTTSSTKKDEKVKYMISTDPSLLSLSALDSAFTQEYMYWVKPLPAPVLKDMIDRSLCFGVYRCSHSNIANDNGNVGVEVDIDTDADPATARNMDATTNLTQIGFARLITDNVTFAYLTDVYILPEYQGTGLGSWLLQCVNAWVDGRGEYFRRFMMVTVGERAEGYYQRVMGVETQGRKGDVFIMGKKGKGAVV